LTEDPMLAGDDRLAASAWQVGHPIAASCFQNGASMS
jgi:hypothetical protein